MIGRLRTRTTRRGQALVELSLILPVLTIVFMSMWQFGIVFTNYIAIAEGARAGARAAAFYGGPQPLPNPPVPTAAQVAAQLLLSDPDQLQATTLADYAAKRAADNLPGLTITVTRVTTWEAGNAVRVTVSRPYQLRFLGVTYNSGTLSSTVQMRIQTKGAVS